MEIVNNSMYITTFHLEEVMCEAQNDGIESTTFHLVEALREAQNDGAESEAFANDLLGERGEARPSLYVSEANVGLRSSRFSKAFMKKRNKRWRPPFCVAEEFRKLCKRRV